jgi:ribosomal protein L24
VSKGDRVVVLAGERAGVAGVVVATYRDRGCGCRSVIVRLDSGREWAGKASEVRPA